MNCQDMHVCTCLFLPAVWTVEDVGVQHGGLCRGSPDFIVSCLLQDEGVP